MRISFPIPLKRNLLRDPFRLQPCHLPRRGAILSQNNKDGCGKARIALSRKFVVALTIGKTSVRLPKMARTGKPTKRSRAAASSPSRSRKIQKNKEDSKVAAHAEAVRQMVDPQFEQQLKLYEQAVQNFQQQKFAKAKELLEKVEVGPSKELADRARIHLRIVEQRMAKQAAP